MNQARLANFIENWQEAATGADARVGPKSLSGSAESEERQNAEEEPMAQTKAAAEAKEKVEAELKREGKAEIERSCRAEGRLNGRHNGVNAEWCQCTQKFDIDVGGRRLEHRQKFVVVISGRTDQLPGNFRPA
jgi:hypothetical protein